MNHSNKSTKSDITDVVVDVGVGDNIGGGNCDGNLLRCQLIRDKKLTADTRIKHVHNNNNVVTKASTSKQQPALKDKSLADYLCGGQKNGYPQIFVKQSAATVDKSIGNGVVSQQQQQQRQQQQQQLATDNKPKYDPQRAFRDKQRRIYGNCRRRYVGGFSDVIDLYDSNSSNDGDGDARRGLPPLQPKLFVISDNLSCTESSSDFNDYDTDSLWDSDYGDDNSSIASEYYFDDEYTVTDSEYLLKKQARDLEHFISDPEETTRLSHREREEKLKEKYRNRRKRHSVRRGFFNIPGEVEIVRYKTQEESRSDWVVVSIELERTESCDSLLDENLCNLVEEATKNLPTILANEEPIAEDPNPNLPSIDEDYGLIYARNRQIRRVLRLFRFFDFDIRFGRPLTDAQRRRSLNSLIQAGIEKAEAEDKKRRQERREARRKVRVAAAAAKATAAVAARAAAKAAAVAAARAAAKNKYKSYKATTSTKTFKPTDSFTYAQDPCCSKTMDVETDKMANAIFQGSIDANSKPVQPIKNESEEFCIPKYFGLNDDGDIIIHLDHIVEQKGYGFLMRRKEELYRRIGFGHEIDEFHPIEITLSSIIKNYVKTVKIRRFGKFFFSKFLPFLLFFLL